jgi:hypothetical protein
MTRLVLAIVGLVLLTSTSLAQQSQKPDLQIIASVSSKETENAELSVRLLNRSDHALRIPVRGFMCADLPGWISVHFKFTPADQSKTEREAGPRGCGISFGSPVDFDIVAEAARWKLLLPGESLEIHDEFSKVFAGSIKRGTYNFRAVYSGKDVTEDQQRKLTAAGVAMPLGQYESNEVVLKIP